MQRQRETDYLYQQVILQSLKISSQWLSDDGIWLNNIIYFFFIPRLFSLIKKDVSESRSDSVTRQRKASNLVEPLDRVNFGHCAR